jgi:hypothetical protein
VSLAIGGFKDCIKMIQKGNIEYVKDDIEKPKETYLSDRLKELSLELFSWGNKKYEIISNINNNKNENNENNENKNEINEINEKDEISKNIIGNINLKKKKMK